MDTKVTISGVEYSLTEQQPTGNVRSGLANGVRTRIVTNHQLVTPKGQPTTTRTVRKVEQSITSMVNGNAVTLPVTVSLVVTAPEVLPVASIDAPLAILLAWAAQADFAGEIRTKQI